MSDIIEPIEPLVSEQLKIQENLSSSEGFEFYGDILAFEDLLASNLIESDPYKRMVLAREIALIEHFATNFRYHDLISQDVDRQSIRERILVELIDQTIPKNDDDIKIGYGGCKPRNRVRCEKKAIILLGLPASGKSTVAQIMSDMQGAYIIDSDFAKRKFPELAFPNGADWTHVESDQIAFDGLFVNCINSNANMVIPKIGANPDSIKELYEVLYDKGYSVSLGLVWLEPQKALRRAIKRYQSSKRYIPIFKITEVYGTKPLDTYHKLVSELKLEHFVQLSSDVEYGEPYTIEHLSSGCIWW